MQRPPNFTDVQWNLVQPRGEPRFFIGDIVEFEAGGRGIISEVRPPQSGHPSQYSCYRVPVFDFHPTGKAAWHYELDFKRLVKWSPLRKKAYRPVNPTAKRLREVVGKYAEKQGI